MCKDKETCDCGCGENFTVNKGLQVGSSKIRREGKHLIAPGVMAIAGVMNGALLPADEIKPADWENMPLVLRHPRKDGKFVPNATEGADTVKIGFVANASFDTRQRLRAEYHFDTEAMRLLPEGPKLLAALENGRMLEQSTGYLHDFTANEGTYNGKRYRGIQRNVKPDHVAILPDDVGACSIADGCGVLQVNMAQVMPTPTDSVMVAFFLEPEDAQRFAMAAQDLPDGSEVVPADQLHVTLAYLGKVDDLSQRTTERELMQRLAEMARHEVFVNAEVQGHGRFASDKETEPIWLSVGGIDLHSFQQRIASFLGYLMPVPKHGFTPHITLAYLPKGESVAIPMPNRESISFSSIALAWGGRASLFKLQGELRPETPELATNKEISMEDTSKTNGQGEQGKGAPATVVVEKAVEKEVPMIAVNQEQLNELLGLSAAIKSAGGIGNLIATVKEFAANQKTERESLIGVLAANQSLGMSAEELGLLPTPTLQRMARTHSPADYSVRGGLATNAQNDGWETFTGLTDDEGDKKTK